MAGIKLSQKTKDYRKAYYRANHRKLNDAARRNKLKSQYNLTPEQFTRMLEEQGGCCAICRRPELARTAAGKPRELSVDHCHRTERVRGLLCNACNSGLGTFGDDPLRLQNAAHYLLRSVVN
jgi:hypothetical protein